MKRRIFCRYAAVSSACFGGIFGRDWAVAMSSKSAPDQPNYKWVVLYWMPYDNNLSRFGEPIVEMLTLGTHRSPALVVVQSDYSGDQKMRRRLLVGGKVREINLTEEDSSDVSNFSAYLDWAYQSLEAERWAIIVVGHAGKLNEISPDEHRATGEEITWMGVDRFAGAVKNFNQATGGRVELLFFQNCNKATLEVIYEARHCARYTLASQLNLGAPNYYYQRFLYRLKDPLVGGLEAATAIIDSEWADMYHSFTLVDNRAVEQIPEKLSRVILAILGGPLPAVNPSELSIYGYFGEQHCDLLNLLGYLSRIGGRGESELGEFAEFLGSEVISRHKTGGKLYGSRFSNHPNVRALSGLGLYFPETRQDIDRYASLALYQRVDFIGLYKKIIKS
ncbi:MAG: clostripain-related cysteine peptidase [Limnoraphis robusta]|uniref:Clostripain family protease n=1 Tax=Limnoraphis robusta CS-951 TaxID=1637645 RepID=A0A0J9EWA8_9CYAN|nr:clostripain-related cysteine peptidase [Limnoraphis robusta]KMW70351.1 clostripain family protease [Limnoraphis robusta CS-951]